VISDRAAGSDAERTSYDIATIIGKGEPESTPNLARPAEQAVFRAGVATRLHQRLALEWFEGAKQDRTRGSGRVGGDVQAVVHSVTEIHVGHPGWSEHHLVAGGRTPVGV
jgi:hypothetical protein